MGNFYIISWITLNNLILLHFFLVHFHSSAAILVVILSSSSFLPLFSRVHGARAAITDNSKSAFCVGFLKKYTCDYILNHFWTNHLPWVQVLSIFATEKHWYISTVVALSNWINHFETFYTRMMITAVVVFVVWCLFIRESNYVCEVYVGAGICGVNWKRKKKNN